MTSLELPAEAEASLPPEVAGLLDAVATFIAVLDGRGVIVALNRNAAREAGLSPENLIRSPLWECSWWATRPDDRLRVQDAVRSATQGVAVDVPIVFVRPDGSEGDLALRLAPWRDGAGRTRGAVATAVDASARMRAERLDREREAHALSELSELETIYRTAPVGLALFDREMRVVRMNEALAEINGFSVDEHIGRKIWDLVPDLRAEAEPLLRRVLENGETFETVELEGETRKAPGVVRQWLEHFYPVRNATGEVAGIGVICEEVTERRRVDTQLRKERNRLRAVLEGMGEGFLVLDRDFRIIEINSEAQRLDGRPASQIVGHLLLEVWPEAEAMPTWSAYQRAMLERTPVSLEYRHRSATHDLWLDVRVYPIDAGLAVFYRDVTDRRRSQSELETLNAELESRIARAVEDRERALTLLHESQKLEAIGQLTGGVAHDFNNLLSAILANLVLARKQVSDPRTVKLIDGAIQGAQRGASLTTRLLAFARRQDLRSEAVDVPSLIADMQEMLQRSLGPRIVVQTQFADPLPFVGVDRNQLELAILNLAVNARDAMPEGGALTIEASAEERNGAPFVRLTVRDDGAGMDQATLQRATEPFFTTKGVGKGTGLGLSMVQGFVAQTGGHMRIESAPGRGAAVVLWLPCAPPGANELRVPDIVAARAPVRSLKILVVDDDGLVRMGTAAMLEDIGHFTIEAAGAADALSILRARNDIDLIVTDHGMPGMSGAEFARVARKEWPGIPIILATGYAELPGGADPDLPRLDKPIRQGDLADLVARLAG